MSKKNLTMPGNIRYQPKDLRPIFGYDNLFRPIAEVEIATLLTLGEIGVIPKEEIDLLDNKTKRKLLAIRTSEVDILERSVTKHDIRAWVMIAQNIVHPKLQKWVHIPLTSCDALDTGRAIQYLRAYEQVIKPKMIMLVNLFIERINTFSGITQIGRTHGQHAIPITVGFWWANILSRMLYNFKKIHLHAGELTGKISGAVGAYNAQVCLGTKERLGNFECKVLNKLKLKSSEISSQINPPEPLGYFLFSSILLSASLGQFGRDCRNLMRSEIGEIFEPFGSSQVGSSTMAHKRNPITFENIEGMWLKTKNEFGKVLDSLLSEHQRDLVSSSVYRDFPIIIINLVNQIDTLCKKDEQGKAFLSRISIDEKACFQNVKLQGSAIIAEPLYIALQISGYDGDAHNYVNHKLIPLMTERSFTIYGAIKETGDEKALLAFERIPKPIIDILMNPSSYIGDSKAKALHVSSLADKFIKDIS